MQIIKSAALWNCFPQTTPRQQYPLAETLCSKNHSHARKQETHKTLTSVPFTFWPLCPRALDEIEVRQNTQALEIQRFPEDTKPSPCLAAFELTVKYCEVDTQNKNSTL